MKTYLLKILLTTIAFSSSLGLADGPGSTSGGKQCKQFTSGILSQVKEAFQNKEFTFLNTAQYSKIFLNLPKIEISDFIYDLNKNLDMETDIDNWLIRVDQDYCNTTNKSYSPIPTFTLLVHEVLNFSFTELESKYKITAPNYQEILNVATQHVGTFNIGYTRAEYSVLKEVKKLIANKKSKLYLQLKKIHEKEFNLPSEATLDEVLTDAHLQITALSHFHNVEDQKKYNNNCIDNNTSEKCQIYQIDEDWTQQFIITIPLPSWIHEGSLIHEEYYKAAFLFEYTLAELTEYKLDSKDYVYSNYKLIKRSENVKSLGRLVVK